MAQRKTIAMNSEEEYLRRVMAGDVPASILNKILSDEEKYKQSTREAQQGEPEQNKPMEPVTDSESGEETPVTKEIQKPVARKKREHKDYESLFLVKRINTVKRQTYISKEIYQKIKRILTVINNQISITAYLDNILIHHLEEYKDDINELYDKNYEKPF